MNKPRDEGRRTMIKTLGAGATLLALGRLGAAEAAKAPDLKAKELPHDHELHKAPKEIPPQPFVLPPLAYGYDALEPVIDARTMELHHSKHHQAYIDSANRALAPHGPLQKKTGETLLLELSALPEPLRTSVRNHVGGHLNHSLFWKILSPRPQPGPGPSLLREIERSFGSYESFKTRFIDTAMKRFGSGWVWVMVDASGRLELSSLPNQDSPLMYHKTPILGVDVWEHAYYLHYQNRRLDYLEAIWSKLHWAEIDTLHTKAVDEVKPA